MACKVQLLSIFTHKWQLCYIAYRYILQATELPAPAVSCCPHNGCVRLNHCINPYHWYLLRLLERKGCPRSQGLLAELPMLVQQYQTERPAAIAPAGLLQPHQVMERIWLVCNLQGRRGKNEPRETGARWAFYSVKTIVTKMKLVYIPISSPISSMLSFSLIEAIISR